MPTSLFSTDSGSPFTDDEVPDRPLHFALHTSPAATRDDILRIVTRHTGTVQQIEVQQHNGTQVEWRIEFYPRSLSAAAETVVHLLDLGELSFALPDAGSATN